MQKLNRKTPKEKFIGKWESIDRETRPTNYGGKNYLRRYLHNTENEANGKLVFYSDEPAEQLKIILSVIGPYHFVKLSQEVSGATEADLDFTKFIVNPKSEAMVKILNDSRPQNSNLKPWMMNGSQTADTTIEEGAFGMVTGNYKEDDLIKIEDDKLYFRARPADGSAQDGPKKRPQDLPVPLKRVEDFSIIF